MKRRLDDWLNGRVGSRLGRDFEIFVEDISGEMRWYLYLRISWTLFNNRVEDWGVDIHAKNTSGSQVLEFRVTSGL